MDKRLDTIKEYIERADYHSLELDGIEISMINPQGLEVHRFNTTDSALDDFLLNGVQDVKYLINEVERLQHFERKAIYTIEENKRLREALKFYADKENYYRSYTEDFSKVHNEGGKIARQALNDE